MKYKKTLSLAFLATQSALAGCLMTGDEPVLSNERFAIEATAEQCYIVADVNDRRGQDVLFVVDKSQRDPSGVLHWVGSMGADDVEAIAFDPTTRTLYAADGDQLGTVDVTTGAFTPLAQTFGAGHNGGERIEFDDVDGLAFDPTTGTLYGSVRRDGTPNLPDLLIIIDRDSGAHVPDAFGPGLDYVVIPDVEGKLDIDDLAIDSDGTMFAVANTSGDDDRLVEIDKRNGRVTDIGATVINDVEGLGIDASGHLWGSAGRNKQLYRLDKASGEASGVVSLEMEQFTDFEALDCLTTTPELPEPPVCETSPALPQCRDVEPPTGLRPARYPEVEYSVVGGGCSVSSGASGDGLVAILAVPALVLGRRLRRRKR